MGYYSFRGRSPPLRPPAPAVLRLVARRRACGAGLQRAHPRQQARVRLARSDRQEGPGPALPGVVVQAVRDRVGGAGARRERYRERGVEVLALHVQDTTVDAQRFVSEQNVTYPVASTRGSRSRTASASTGRPTPW